MINKEPSHRIKTLNSMGYMFSSPNPAFIAFLDHVERTQGHFADIGAAFGHSTFEALKRGGHVTAIDLDQHHLDILVEECPSTQRSRLEIQCGHFPNTISLSSNAYDGILLSRILVFLTQAEISLALSESYKALSEGGSIYVVCPGPLGKKWQPVRPIYNQQKLRNDPWPGRIENLWDFMPEQKGTLPNTVQLIDSESLEQGLIRTGFSIETCAYYPVSDTAHHEALALTYAIGLKHS